MVIRVAEGAGYSIDHEGNGASASMISILTLFTQYLVPTFEILAFAIDIARDGGDANMNPRLFVVDRLPKLNEDFIDNTNHSYDAGRRATMLCMGRSGVKSICVRNVHVAQLRVAF